MNETAGLAKEKIEKILLVRPSFRMGNSILATPLIFLFRQNFPNARIDFVGSPMSSVLFRDLPINRHYQVTRRFPNASWAYFTLIRDIRAVGYDLAVELSGSQSAMGAWIVGLSGSRCRVGMQGKRDRWFDVRLPKPKTKNKYEMSSALASSMGLSGSPLAPKMVLSASEREEALRKTASVFGGNTPDVGVFLGGRVQKSKRWPKDNFVELIKDLRGRGIKVLIFVGPEEEDLRDYFRRALSGQVPVIYEKSLRLFAALVSTCKLFVACDSGPMHLACALGVRTVAIFQKRNFNHWGPPSSLARIVHSAGVVQPRRVLRACLLELWRLEKTAVSQLGS
ncbi:MAG: glycosyltransferase family 9 protein [Candidatus Binatia bacterium]